jgi:hypothetical protein
MGTKALSSNVKLYQAVRVSEEEQRLSKDARLFHFTYIASYINVFSASVKVKLNIRTLVS